MGITHSKKLKNIPKLSVKKKITLIKRKSSVEESINAYNKEHSNRNSELDYPIVNLSLPPSPTYTFKDIEPKLTETIIINDRKYQNTNKKYMLPVDDQEQDKLVQEHFLYQFIFGGNFSAPVRDLLSGHYSSDHLNRNSAESSNLITNNYDSSPRILDVACGNGTWILEMATEFPNSSFYGIDFSPSYPTTIKPPNSFFSKHDILNPDGLPFPDNYFDYIFMRQVYTCFSESDWTFVVKEIKRVVKPGGYVEFRDLDPMLRKVGAISSDIFTRYPDLMKENHGVDVLWARYMFDYLQNVGEMTDMHIQNSQLRFGCSGPIGEMIDASLRSGFESHRLFFERCYNILRKDYNKVIDDIVQESVTRHSFFNYYACWGRKPLLDYDSSSSLRKQSLSISSREELMLEHCKFPFSKFSIKEDCCEDITSFNVDNVSDIDQFIEGFED